MGLQKIALNFVVERGSEIAKSLLCSKPAKIPDISKLGVCLSNGNIHFQTEESAINYLRHRLLDSLSRPVERQFERGISKRGTRILAESNGNAFSCPFPHKNSKEISQRMDKNAIRDVELWHSHVDIFGMGKSAPLSPPTEGDIQTLFNFHLKKVVAMNSKGEINSIEVANGFSAEEFKKFREGFEEFYNSELVNLLPQDLKIKYAKLEKIFKENNSIPSSMEKELKDIVQAIRKLEETGEGAKILHKYYQKAEHYGMKYFTDFSNLR